YVFDGLLRTFGGGDGSRYPGLDFGCRQFWRSWNSGAHPQCRAVPLVPGEWTPRAVSDDTDVCGHVPGARRILLALNSLLTREHHYSITTTWTGNLGTGTSDYRAYSRDHEITIAGKSAPLPGSSDAAFRGEPARYTPEELLVASLSACHMLWFLHLCADAGIAVTEYKDGASGAMAEHVVTDPDAGSGEFTRVTLRPRVMIVDPARIADA